MFTTIADLSPTPAPDHRCRFVKVTGARCRVPAKPGSDLCTNHHYRKSFTRGRFKPNPPATFNTVPLVRFAWAEDHDSILFNCNQIALALVSSTINAREAGALNALMHTAQRSLSQKFVHERFEARERERAAQAPAPLPSPDPNLDYVTDYVIDVDGMPLALPDPPNGLPQPETPDNPSLSSPAVPEDSVGSTQTSDNAETPGSPETPAAPSLSSSAVQEDKVGSINLQKDEPESDAAKIARKRDSIYYLREYFKNDPKMLAEIESYPEARYAPKPKFEPQPEPATLSTLNASAEPAPILKSKLSSREQRPGAGGAMDLLFAGALPDAASQREPRLTPEFEPQPEPALLVTHNPIVCRTSTRGPIEVPCFSHIATPRDKIARQPDPRNWKTVATGD